MKKKNQSYIILLRGVMPMGKNKVPMATLRELLTKAGLIDVRTYIQSGNVLLKSELEQSELEDLIHKLIKTQIGADISVVARTNEQFRTILNNNPFHKIDTSKIYFTVMQTMPADDKLQTFMETDFSPDIIVLINDVLYVNVNTLYSNSKFNNNWIESKLKIRATTRNFNTMTKLAEMAQT